MPKGEVGAKLPNKENSLEPQDVEKEFFISVFFDGTNNKMETNTQQETAERARGGALVGPGSVAEAPVVNFYSPPVQQKDTNVAALSYLVEDKTVRADGKVKYYYHIYIEGPGTTYDGDHKRGWFEKLRGKPAEIVGQAIGTWSQGVIAKVARGVSEVHTFLNGKTAKKERQTVKLHFCVYGFSRGAACARLFAYLVARANDTDEAITFEYDFKDYLDGVARSLYTDRLRFLDDYKKENRIVEFLGIYDTASSIGIIDETGVSETSLMEDVKIFHNMNARDYGLYSPQMANVKRTFHICAIDEFRKNFAITDVGKKVPPNCIEVFVPGCHSDVGGSYEDNKDSTVCLKTARTFGKTKLVMKDPRYPENGTGFVNKENLMALGWAVDKCWYEEAWDNVTSFWNRSFLLDYYQNTISFTRTVSRGISNITFVMMWERTHQDTKQVWGCDLFNDHSVLPGFSVPKELSSLAGKMDAKKLGLGKRSWIIPGGSLDSNDYRTLRRKYIHFSATDRLGISIVNEPNWKDNILCRIVYHGDRNDSGIYYMQDYD